MKPALLFFAGELAGRRIRLRDDGPTILGRNEEADIRVADRLISSYHFMIEEKEGCLFLRDFQSRNGTLLNGQAVHDPVEIHPGDILSAGQLQCEVELGTAPGEAQRKALLSPSERLQILDRLDYSPESLLKVAQALPRDDGAKSPSSPDRLIALVGSLLLSEAEEEEVLRQICWALRYHYRIDRTMVIQSREENAPVPLALSHNARSRLPKDWPAASDVVAASLDKGILIRHHDLISLPDSPDAEEGLAVRTVLCAPVPREKVTWGVIYLEKTVTLTASDTTFTIPPAFSDTDFNVVAVLGQVLGLKLERRKAQAERLRMEEEILQAIEGEQARFGRDLHDVLIQQLSGIQYISQVVARRLKNRELPEAEKASEITTLLREAIVQARYLVEGLHPPNLLRDGLLPALMAFAGNVEAMYETKCSFCAIPGNAPVGEALSAFSVDIQTQIYRIVQESVNNALKHAAADRIEIQAEAAGGWIMLRVCDSGLGISQPVEEVMGIGLRSMAYRATLIGANLSVQNTPEGGTCVECVLPRREAPENQS